MQQMPIPQQVILPQTPAFLVLPVILRTLAFLQIQAMLQTRTPQTLDFLQILATLQTHIQPPIFMGLLP